MPRRQAEREGGHVAAGGVCKKVGILTCMGGGEPHISREVLT